MKTPVTRDELIGAALLLASAGEHLECDETIVELSMKPLSLFKPDYVYSRTETESVFVGLLRTAGYFLLDRDESLPALTSEPPVGEIIEFPPLPFPRCWIECRDDDGPREFVNFEGEGDEDDLRILGVGIIERTPGQLWDVLMPFEFQPKDGKADGFRVIAHSITPTGFADDIDKQTWNEIGADSDPATAIIGLAITASHLITADKVPHEEVVVIRQARKRWEKEYKRPRFPEGARIYFVDLKAAGDDKTDAPGGGREYHVRWLRRGHYRKHPSGKWLIKNKGRCTWVKACVCGPAGKPWKGRPVYLHGNGGTAIE
jgi:hypothetical protein